MISTHHFCEICLRRDAHLLLFLARQDSSLELPLCESLKIVSHGLDTRKPLQVMCFSQVKVWESVAHTSVPLELEGLTVGRATQPVSTCLIGDLEAIFRQLSYGQDICDPVSD